VTIARQLCVYSNDRLLAGLAVTALGQLLGKTVRQVPVEVEGPSEDESLL